MKRGLRRRGLLLALAIGCARPAYISTEEANCKADREPDLACGDTPGTICLSHACVDRATAQKWAVEIVLGPAPVPADGGVVEPHAARTQLPEEGFPDEGARLYAWSTKALHVTFAAGNTTTKLPASASVILTVPTKIPGLPDLSFTTDAQEDSASATLTIPRIPIDKTDQEEMLQGTLQLLPSTDEGTSPPYVFPVTVPASGPLAQTVGGTQSIRGSIQSAFGPEDTGFDPTNFVARAYRGGALISNNATFDSAGKVLLQISSDAAIPPLTITFAPKANTAARSDPWFVSDPIPTLPVTTFDVTLPSYRSPGVFSLPIRTVMASEPALLAGTRVRATTTMLHSTLGTTTYAWESEARTDGRAPLVLLPGSSTDARSYRLTITPPVGSPSATTCPTIEVRAEPELPSVVLIARPVVSGSVSSATHRKLYNVAVTATWLGSAPPADGGADLAPSPDGGAEPAPPCVPAYRTTSTTTDLQGRFQLNLDPGYYRFDYDPPPGAPVPRKTERRVPVTADVDWTVELAPAAYVQGTVRDKAGQVLPMAIVRLYGVVCEEGEDCGGPNRPPRELKAEAQADKDGKFIAVVPHP